jgi:hypothetical protein
MYVVYSDVHYTLILWLYDMTNIFFVRMYTINVSSGAAYLWLWPVALAKIVAQGHYSRTRESEQWRTRVKNKILPIQKKTKSLR